MNSSIKYSMDYESYQTYLHEYNVAVQRYAGENNINPMEVVNMLALGELKLNDVKEVTENA